MQPLRIITEDDRDAFVPGEQIDVLIAWNLVEMPDRIELRLVWNTAGKGDADLSVEEIQEFAPPDAAGTHKLSLTLPIGPYSFSGKLISLIWALEAVAHPGSETLRREITIGPEGREVQVKKSTASD